jgi:hypothetical protein
MFYVAYSNNSGVPARYLKDEKSKITTGISTNA